MAHSLIFVPKTNLSMDELNTKNAVIIFPLFSVQIISNLSALTKVTSHTHVFEATPFVSYFYAYPVINL